MGEVWNMLRFEKAKFCSFWTPTFLLVVVGLMCGWAEGVIATTHNWCAHKALSQPRSS